MTTLDISINRSIEPPNISDNPKIALLKTNRQKVLFTIYILNKQGFDSVTSAEIIRHMNSPSFLTVIDSEKQEIKSGSVYGTLSRLKGEGFIIRVLRQTEEAGDELTFKITGKGVHYIEYFFESAHERIDNLRNFEFITN